MCARRARRTDCARARLPANEREPGTRPEWWSARGIRGEVETSLRDLSTLDLAVAGFGVPRSDRDAAACEGGSHLLRIDIAVGHRIAKGRQDRGSIERHGG